MREVISYLLRPSTFLWLLLLISLVLVVRQRRKSSLILLSISVCWFAIISTRFLPELLIERLESTYPPIDLSVITNSERPVRIMVLGGGFSDDPTIVSNDRLSLNSLARIIEAIRIQRLVPGSKIVSGGFDGKLKTDQSKVFLETALSLGVDSVDVICTKIKKNNTAGETEAYFKAFGNSNCSTILVTDALHMPRAMNLFRKYGLKPIAAPTNHIIKENSYRQAFSWRPSSINIYLVETAMHEYLGMLWSKLGGK